jgi:hypothetical protein
MGVKISGIVGSLDIVDSLVNEVMIQKTGNPS